MQTGKMVLASRHLEQSSNGTNDTSNTEAAERETRGATFITRAGAAARGGGGSRGLGVAVKGVMRIGSRTLY